jgi:hypothetical protein
MCGTDAGEIWRKSYMLLVLWRGVRIVIGKNNETKCISKLLKLISWRIGYSVTYSFRY